MSEKHGIVVRFHSLAQKNDLKSYYIGSTDNIVRRFAEHIKGKAKATKRLRPLNLVFKQEFGDLSQARQIERRLKKFKSRKIIKQIIKDKEIKLSR